MWITWGYIRQNDLVTFLAKYLRACYDFVVMKKLFLLPLQFCLSLIGAIVLLSGLRLLWLYSFNATWIGLQLSLEPFLFFIALFVDILLPALVITWFVMMFRVLHLQKYRYGALLVNAIVWALGFFCFSVISNSIPSVSMLSIPLQKAGLPGSSVLKYEGGYLLRVNSTDEKKEAWYIHEGLSGSVMQPVEDMRVSDDGSALLLPQRAQSIKLSSLDPAPGKQESGWFMVEWFIESFTAIRSSLTSSVKTLNLLQILMWSSALSLALHSLWFFIRLSRWPLFNFFCALAMLLVLFQLTAWLSMSQNLANFSFLPDAVLTYTGPLVLSLFGLFFWSLNLFLQPVKDWQKEVGL